MVTWHCPLCEDAYGSEQDVREHVTDTHDESPDDYTIKESR